LPSNVSRLTYELRAAKLPPLTSAIEPALAGAIQHAQAHLAEHPTQQPAVVLITDGFLDATCASTSEGLAMLAQQGLASSIPTYIVELRAFQVPIPGPGGSVIIPLSDVAEAGGGERVRRINLVGAEPQDLRNALLDIQRDAAPCDYVLPEDGVWEDLFLAINTTFAGPIPILRLDDESECSLRGGLYLIDPNASSDEPRWARACEASCAAIKNSRRTPSWLYGCAANPDAGR
jgi:hypothetical protein